MEEKEIEQRVKRIICDELCIRHGTIERSSDLIRDLGADSLDSVKVKMEIEKEFNIVIQEDVTGELDTVGGLIDYVVKMTN